MADVDDQWHKVLDGRKVRTDRYGKGKQWRARWRDEIGRQRQESFTLKRDADRHVATVKTDMLRRTYIDPNAGKVTFRAYAEKWRAAQVHEETTVAQVETHFRRHVYPVFGDRQMASIKPTEAQAWVRGMEVGRDDRPALMPATVQVIYRYVVAVCHAAVADKVISANPFVKLARTKPVKKRVQPPTGKQVAAVRRELPMRLAALADLGAGCGLRQGEAFAVELDCVDFLRRQLIVRQQLVIMPRSVPHLRLPKGRKIRTVPLADTILAGLSEHVRKYPPRPVRVEDQTNPAKPVFRDARFLFVEADGTPMRRTSFSSGTWCHVQAAAKLPKAFTFHDLRHYFASALIRYGESVKTVQERLGHATAAETLDTYGHLWPDSEDRTRAAIEDAFTADVGAMWADQKSG